VLAAGLTPVGAVFHVFPPPGGVTGVVLLAESHLAVHTWPERGVVTLDVYVCNVSGDNSAAASQVVDALVDAFAPGQVQRRYWLRGQGAPDDRNLASASASASAIESAPAPAPAPATVDRVSGP
jgi:S-adenosylmethionine decarboxylase